jgi:hypothetical protein
MQKEPEKPEKLPSIAKACICRVVEYARENETVPQIA